MSPHTHTCRALLLSSAFLASFIGAEAATTITVNGSTNNGANTNMARSSSQGSSQQAYYNQWGFWPTLKNRFKELNTDQVRIGVSISYTGTGSNIVVDFTNMDAMVDAIVGDGAHPFPIMSTGKTLNIPTSDITNIITQVVSRYKTRNPGAIQYWEITNEPNLPDSGIPSATEYLAYYAVAAPAIKAADPAAKVGGMALSVLDSAWTLPFLDAIKSRKDSPSTADDLPLDFFSWHFYNNGQGPHGRTAADLASEINTARSWLSARNLTAEILITEFNLHAQYFRKMDQTQNGPHILSFIEDISTTFASNPVHLFFFQPKDSISYAGGKYVNNIWHVYRFFGCWSFLSYDNYTKPVYNALKMRASMPGTKIATSMAALPGVGVKAAKGGSGATAIVEVLAWNNSNTPQDLSVYATGLPFTASTLVEYTRTDVDERSGNSAYNLLNSELSLVADLDTSTPSTLQKRITFTGTIYTTPVFTLKPFGVTKLVFRAAATTVPAAPTGVTASPHYQKNLVRWTEVSNATSYNILRSTSAAGTYTTIARDIKGTIYPDCRAAYNVNYYYKVQATTNGGTSTASASAGPALWSYTTLFQIQPVTYADRFDSNSSIGQWYTAGGSWSVANGELVQSTSTSASGVACLRSVQTGNYVIISTDMRFTAGTGWGALVVRRTSLTGNPWSTGYVITCWASGTMSISKNGVLLPSNTGVDPNDPDDDMIGQAASPLRPAIEPVDIRCVLNGSLIEVYGDGTLYLRANDTTYNGGYVAAAFQNTAACFDNFEVTHNCTFTDDFATATAPNWKTYGGTWSAAVADFQQTTTTRTSHASCATPSFENGSAEADIKITGNSGSHWAALAIKRTNPEDTLYGSGYIVYLKSSGNLGVYNCLTNALIGSEIATGTTPAVSAVKLKVTFEDSTIRVYVNGSTTPLATINDRSFVSGTIALCTNACSATFDNVKISE